MKILMVVSVPFFHTQGTAFSCLDRALTLRDLGHCVDIVTYPKGQEIHLDQIRIFRSGGHRFIKDKWQRGPTLYKALLTLCMIPTVIKRLRTGEYDCLHAHEDSAYFCAFIKAISGIPFIYDMHSSLPEQLQAFSIKKKLILKLLNRLESFTIRNADAMMVICRHLYDKVQSMAPDKSVYLAENLPIMTLRDDKIFDSDITPGQIRKEFNLDHQPVVLYTGSLGRNQGIDLLIDSARCVIRENRKVIFMLVGGEQKEIDYYQSIVKENGLEANFIFTGARNPAEMSAFMAMSSCLVSPRITGKNTPLKIYSYMESKKPIIATDIYSHTQVFNHNNAVLRAPDAESYADGILWAVNNPNDSALIGEAGAALLEQRYARSEYIRQHICLYESIAQLLDQPELEPI